MIDFSGKTVLITGGAGEIGLEIARLLIACGGRVHLVDLNPERLLSVTQSLGGSSTATYSVADVADSAAVKNAVEECAHVANGAVDGAVNAAGIYPEIAVAEMGDREWREVLDINLSGTFYVCRSLIQHFRTGSSVVNLTSIAAHRGSVRHAHYAAAKAGVLGFSRSLAQELAPNVRVNCLSPGPVDTAMIRPLMEKAGDKILAATPLRRICRADEVAKVTTFLLSDWASFITGETVHLNGGHYIYG